MSEVVQSTRVLVGFDRAASPRTAIGATRFAVERWRGARRPAELVTDALLTWLAVWLAHAARYRWDVGGPVLAGDRQPFATFHGTAALFFGLALAVFLVRGVYRLPRSTALLDELFLVAGGLTTAMAGVVLFAFLLRFAPSRLVVVYAWTAALLLLTLRRILTRIGQRWLWRRGIAVDRVLVVGAGETGRRVLQAMMGQPALGYRVVGFVDDDATGDGVPVATEHRVAWAERLGRSVDVAGILARRRIDQVVIALPAADHDRVLDVIGQCRARDVPFKVVPDLLQIALDRVDLGQVGGVPLIGVKDASIRGGNYLLKRAIDVALALIMLAAMAIPMALIALLVRHDSAGPILCRQRRLGRDGRAFTMTKFRSMVDGADRQWPELVARGAAIGEVDPRLAKLRHDPRLTRSGRFLRRWSLDELPQFFQVLRGEMSVVGPRPPLPREAQGYEEWHRQRLLVTPGLTGLWQVNGRSALGFDEMVRLDLYYAEHWSPWLDVKIILRTVQAVVTGEGAY